MPSFRLRSTRRRSISRRALTRLESRTWAVCFGCAPQSRARSPQPYFSRALSPCMRHLRPPAPPPARGAHFAPYRYAFLVTPQNAWAFNQPLSFDTSKVTTMERMLAVRSSRVLRPGYTVGHSPILEIFPRLHTAPIPLPRISPGLFSMRPPFDLAEYICFVQRQQAPHPVCVGGQRGLQ